MPKHKHPNNNRLVTTCQYKQTTSYYLDFMIEGLETPKAYTLSKFQF